MAHALTRRFPRLVLAGLALLWLCPLPAVPQQGTGAPMPPGVAAYDAYMDGVAQFGAALDRSAFDLDALSLSTALSEPDDIVAAVRARVGFHPYAGSLRGAAGTLRAGAGNSLDTALLLARLMGDAGFDTRIAHATLSERQIDALFARLGRAEGVPPFRDRAAAETAAAVMERASGGRGLGPAVLAFALGDGASPGMPDVVQEGAARAVTALGPALPAADALAERIRAEAAAYYWVQTRAYGAEPWVDRHVLLDAQTALTPERFVADPLPPEMRHTLSLQADIWVRDGVKTTTTPLFRRLDFTPDSAPVLSIVPSAALQGQRNVLLAAPDSRFFFPLVNGVLPDGARAFTPRGQVLAASDVLSGGASADLVAEVGAKVSASTDIFAGLPGAEKEAVALPPNSPVQEVLGIVLTLTHTPPEGGARRTWRRHIVDRVGATRRAEGQISAAPDAMPTETAVPGRWSVLPATGAIRPAALVAAQADRAQGLRGVMRPAAEGRAVYAFPVENPVQRLLSAYLLDSAAAEGAGAGITAYRAAPGLMIVRQTSTALDGALKQTAGIDILTTGRRALGPDGRPVPEAAIRAGVAETRMEYEMASSIVPGDAPAPVPSASAWQGLAEATALAAITGTGDLPDTLSPGARAAAEADLDAGYILVLAQGGGADPAWWRIDPLSGAAIGVDALGRGGEAAEYLSLVDAIITGTFIGVGTASCTSGGGGYACCVATNMVWGMLGYGVLMGASKGIEMIFLADAYTAGAIGMATGVGASASGWNPLTGACS